MAVIPLASAGRYIHWGVIQISVTNLVVILLMVALFVAALLIPFPGSRRAEHRGHDDE
jgi:hypothetical protein